MYSLFPLVEPLRWQQHLEARAAVGVVAGADPAAVAAHHAERGGEAEAAARELGGEERVEDARLGMRVDPRA